MFAAGAPSADECDCESCIWKKMRRESSCMPSSTKPTAFAECLRKRVDAASTVQTSGLTPEGKAVTEDKLAEEMPSYAQVQSSRRSRLSTERLPLIGSEINLDGKRITAEKAPAICAFLREHSPKVERLILNANALGDEGARVLAAHLHHDASLTYLALTSCGIGDEGAELLAEALLVNQTLRTLFLSGNPISSAAVAKLEEANAQRTHPMAGLNGLVV